MKSHHQFTPRWRLPIGLSLLLLLIAPTLTAIGVTQQQQQQLTRLLAEDMQQLQAHRQAAEAISARQRAFARTPQPQQDPAQLNGLTLMAAALRDDIALLSLEMDTRQQRLRVEVLSHSLDALLDFVARLQRLPVKVALDSHQTESNMPEPWKIRATLNLEYPDAS
ncbi:hypothetical protein [Pantoea sp. B65]|uniref:hypothetical protein n=1 Tax=Pantoea sp. B65 TaxID=2813359 RepID=UPI0039B3E52F